jgi:hypothetical protein
LEGGILGVGRDKWVPGRSGQPFIAGGKHLSSFRRLSSFIAAAGVLAALVPAIADAGTYVAKPCHADTGWNGTDIALAYAGAYAYNQRCDGRDQLTGGFFLDDVEHGDGHFGYASITAPADLKLLSLRAYRSATSGPGRDFGTPQAFLQAGNELRELFQPYGNAPRAGEGVINVGVNASTLAWGTRCAGSAGCPAGVTAYWLKNLELTMQDDLTPTIENASGSLLDPAATTRTRSVSYTAADRGGGVRNQRLIVDGAERAGGAIAPCDFGRLVPCRLSSPASLSFDTASVPDGQHEGVLRVTDATDDTTSNRADKVFGFVTDNFPPSVPAPRVVGSQAKIGVPLRCTGTADGQSPTVSFAWLRANPDGSATVKVADGQDYTPVAADEGRKLQCQLTATDRGGSASALSSLTDGPFANGATVARADATSSGGSSGGTGQGTGSTATPSSLPSTPAAPAPNAPLAPPSDGSSTALTNGLAANRPVSGEVRLEMTGSRTRTVTFGRRIATVVRLATASGTPIVGARVEVLERDYRPRRKALVGTTRKVAEVISDADGVVRYLIAAGSSRDVTFAYKTRLDDTAVTGSSTLRLLVRGKVTMRTSPASLRNGQTLRFAGFVPGRRHPRGSVVEVQAWAGGARGWIPISVKRLDGRGRYRATYTFRRTTRRSTYRFRAVLRSASDSPYLDGRSPIRHVVVRP